jgi:hypothetical protein
VFVRGILVSGSFRRRICSLNLGGALLPCPEGHLGTSSLYIPRCKESRPPLKWVKTDQKWALNPSYSLVNCHHLSCPITSQTRPKCTCKYPAPNRGQGGGLYLAAYKWQRLRAVVYSVDSSSGRGRLYLQLKIHCYSHPLMLSR